jgi:hypothetical protein
MAFFGTDWCKVLSMNSFLGLSYLKSPRFKLVLAGISSSPVTYCIIGGALLLFDLFMGKYLLFPILFFIPVVLSAWFCGSRLAYLQAFILPCGRFFIDEFIHHPAPFFYIVSNAIIRVAVLLLIAFLVSRIARQSKELERRYNDLVRVCAWSRTVEYQGEWISFEQYMGRRFGVKTTHGISPEEAKKLLAGKTLPIENRN